jgi:hypothetical protein
VNKNRFLDLLNQLPADIDITVQTCRYDGSSDVYDDMEPRLIVNEGYAIITGDKDFYAQAQAAKELSYLSSKTIVRLLSELVPIVKVD